MGARFAAGEHRRCRGLRSDDPDMRILFLQIGAHAGDGPAGADARHKHIHVAIRIRPDFGAGGVPVRLRIGGVDELPREKAVRGLPGQLLGPGNGACHAPAALGQHQLRAIGLHQEPPLHTHGLRHGDDYPVAPGCTHGGQTNSGIAAGGFNDNAAGL